MLETKWFNKSFEEWIIVEYQLALASCLLLFCLFANLVDPITIEDGKSFFSLLVETIGFLASLVIIFLCVRVINQRIPTKFSPVLIRLFFLGVAVWLLYCGNGIYANLTATGPMSNRHVEDAFIGYLTLAAGGLFILTSFGSRHVNVGFVISLIVFTVAILTISLYASREVLWNHQGSLYGIFTRTEVSTGYQISRSSGLARMVVVLLFIIITTLMVGHFRHPNIKSSATNLFLGFFATLMVLLLILIQSRGALLGALISLSFCAFIAAWSRIREVRLRVYLIGGLTSLTTIAAIVLNSLFIPRFGNSSFLSGWSGRGDIWNAIYLGQENLFLGCGFQCDRVISGNSASNGLFYAFATGGILGVATCLAIYSLLILMCIRFGSVITNATEVEIFAWLILPFLIVRTISESGFLVFGFDLIATAIASGILFRALMLQRA